MWGQGRIDCDQILEVVVAAATMGLFNGVPVNVGVLIAGDARERGYAVRGCKTATRDAVQDRGIARCEYARLRDCWTGPTPPSVAGVGHGSEPRWLTHLTGSTRVVSSVSHTRTVVMVAPRGNPGPCCGRSAGSGGSAAETSVTPNVLSCHDQFSRAVSGHSPQTGSTRID